MIISKIKVNKVFLKKIIFLLKKHFLTIEDFKSMSYWKTYRVLTWITKINGFKFSFREKIELILFLKTFDQSQKKIYVKHVRAVKNLFLIMKLKIPKKRFIIQRIFFYSNYFINDINFVFQMKQLFLF